MKIFLTTLSILFSTFTAFAESVQTQRVLRVTGLFSPERVEDLKAAVETIPELKIGKVELEAGEVEFHFDAGEEPFKNAKPEQLIQRIDQRLRNASNHTFGCIDRDPVPRKDLKEITITARGLDCKACAYGAYRSVYKIDGVIQALVSFKDERVTVLMDPKRTEQAALEEALKRVGVELPDLEAKPKE